MADLGGLTLEFESEAEQALADFDRMQTEVDAVAQAVAGADFGSSFEAGKMAADEMSNGVAMLDAETVEYLKQLAEQSQGMQSATDQANALTAAIKSLTGAVAGFLIIKTKWFILNTIFNQVVAAIKNPKQALQDLRDGMDKANAAFQRFKATRDFKRLGSDLKGISKEAQKTEQQVKGFAHAWRQVKTGYNQAKGTVKDATRQLKRVGDQATRASNSMKAGVGRVQQFGANMKTFATRALAAAAAAFVVYKAVRTMIAAFSEGGIIDRARELRELAEAGKLSADAMSEIEQVGGLISSQDLAAVAQVQKGMEEVSQMATAAFGNFFAAMAPTMQALVTFAKDFLKAVGPLLKSLGNAAGSGIVATILRTLAIGLRYLGGVLNVLVNIVKVALAPFSAFFELLAGIADGVMEALGPVFDAFNDFAEVLSDLIPPEVWKRIRDLGRIIGRSLGWIVQKVKDLIDVLSAAPVQDGQLTLMGRARFTFLSLLDPSFNVATQDLAANMQAAANATEDATMALGNLATNANNSSNQLANTIMSILNLPNALHQFQQEFGNVVSAESPLNRFIRQINQINAAAAIGQINQQQQGMAVSAAISSLESAVGNLSDKIGAQGVVAGTTEAVTAIINHEFGATQQSQQERIIALMQAAATQQSQQTSIQQQQLAALQAIQSNPSSISVGTVTP